MIAGYFEHLPKRKYNPQEIQEKLSRASTLAAKAEIKYQRLRRVESELICSRMEQHNETDQVPEGFVSVYCPGDVLRHAQICFNITDPPMIPRIRQR